MASNSAKPKVIFVLGGPGAGKGTICARLVEEFGVVHLSAGDLLRAERQSGSPHGELIEQYIVEGKIVPVQITVNLIKNAMEREIAVGKSVFLVDGFPRDQQNVEGWHEVMGDFAEIAFVLFLDCPEDVMEQRLLNRGVSSGRSDDNIESIRKRFHTYVASTTPIIRHFETQGLVRHVISNRTVEEVYADCRAVVAPLFA
eukprot:TRINITY_DN451_c0_g1_i2.p1 TRINITY_DN451_c0_g1~~TRINITY_DN451_c0_g1_i2.p1  ORF type:complete len:200 (-),score=68.63 TRINITY_DN451_c0_g1_i2:63-662(-)